VKTAIIQLFSHKSIHHEASTDEKPAQSDSTGKNSKLNHILKQDFIFEPINVIFFNSLYILKYGIKF